MARINEVLVNKPESSKTVRLLEAHGMSSSEPLSRTSARLLLNHFNWDIESLAEYLKKHKLDQLFEECNVINPRSYLLQMINEGTLDGEGMGTCGIMAFCDDDLKTEDLFFVKPCNHTFCFDCLKQHVITTINDNQAIIDSIPCPQPGCKIILNDNDVLQLLCHGEDVVIASEKAGTSSSLVPSPETPLSKYYRVIGAKFVEHNKFLTLCPSPNCSKVAQLFNNPSTEAIECPDCLTLFCFPCGRNWHEPLSCDQIKQFETFDDKNLDWMKKKTKNCPGCKSPIEKNHGCNHMTCSRCNYQFCWMCFAKWPTCMTGPNNNPGQCRANARQANQNKTKDYKYQKETFNKVKKSIKTHMEKYKAEQKLRKDFIAAANTRWILPKKVSKTDFRKLVKELALSRLLMVTSYTFSVYYRNNELLVKVFEEREKLEDLVAGLATVMKREATGTLDIVDISIECESQRKVLFGLIDDGLKNNLFEAVGTVSAAPATIEAEPVAGTSRGTGAAGDALSYINGLRGQIDGFSQMLTDSLRSMFAAPARMPIATNTAIRAALPAVTLAMAARRARVVARRGRGRPRGVIQAVTPRVRGRPRTVTPQRRTTGGMTPVMQQRRVATPGPRDASPNCTCVMCA